MLILDKENRPQWRLAPQAEPSLELQQMAKKKNLHPVIVKLLASRGLQDQKRLEEFLEPSLADLPLPLEMGGMKEAVALAGQAVLTGMPIVIWGDYDVDGTTGTALLVSFFHQLGIQATYTIPNRITHGYGLHIDLLQALAPTEPSDKKLLITVDCGISANEEITSARQMGFLVIVTDHHEPPAGFAEADAILNPKQDHCTFPTEELAGVGVAFYLACGIRQYLREKDFFTDGRLEPDVRDLLDLVALGTIADMVPMGRINRILVREGMRRIEQLKRPGSMAMLEVGGLLNKQKRLISSLGSQDIGFLLAPMINAAGRLGEATLAVQLLLSKGRNEAMKLAQELLTLNNRRKKLSQDVYTQATSLQQQQQLETSNCLILKGDYHHGVIGIVASRMVETFRMPAIIFGQEKNAEGKIVFKGSGRSVPGINLHEALENCQDTIIRYGGHDMAAGMMVSEDLFELFCQRIDEAIGRQVKAGDQVVKLTIDLEAEIDEILSLECGKQLHLLEPFGPGNKSPLFYTTKARVYDCQAIGADNGHLKISFKNKDQVQKGIGFGLGPCLARLHNDDNPAIVYSPMANRYRDTLSWEVKVIGLQFQKQ